MWIALAIVLAMVLYLIDKNQKWGAFLGPAKWLGKFAVGVLLWAMLDRYVRDDFTRWIIIGLLVFAAVIWENWSVPKKLI